ncbi:MAG: phosphotransferase, partial [Bacteroidales bacterium]|nr:phosphotransferase [Bacteroidales bacterium]
MENKLNYIFAKFIAEGDIRDAKTLVSGYINETFLIETIGDGHSDYVLQKLNHQVFPNIPELMNNKVKVTEYLREKTKGEQVVLEFFKTHEGLYYYHDEDGFYWNLMAFIPDSKVLETTQNSAQAEEAGQAFGNFIKLLDDFPVDDIY